LLKTIFSHIDCSTILADSRLIWLIGDHENEIINQFKNIYEPLSDGTPLFIPLRMAIELNSPFYKATSTALEEFFTEIKHDIASQAYFGKRWFKNIVYNLLNFKGQQLKGPNYNSFSLVGAGPSLELDREKIVARQQAGGAIIATDAALMPLVGYGIKPNYVITLDAQILVNYHFIGIKQDNFILLADIASPTNLLRRYPCFFYSGGHPLGRLTTLPPLDTSGGNVGFAALALALALGAKPQSIVYTGLDFGYPAGKIYARGSYFFKFYAANSTKLNGLETSTLNLVFKTNNIHKKEISDNIFFYQNDLMHFYGQKFKLFLQKAEHCHWNTFSHNFDGLKFLHNYKNDIEYLIKNKLLSAPVNNLNYQQINAITTLKPLAASFVKQSLKPMHTAACYTLDFLTKIGI
jgi:hypothetical protein